MKDELLVRGADNAPLYSIFVQDSFDGLVSVLRSLQIEGRKICLVSDTNVASFYEKEVRGLLDREGFFCVSFVFPAGEASKNLDTVACLYEFLIEHSFDRNDVLLALGGGVTGDLTGFAAATYLRGIRFIGMPTSLLSMVDSSIGGKTGV
ncbi:MAG: iron-containing alcohol dehydrogenase, partial [Lachnospiraceae bacterium]|nr:iron-containing alcohol dehydrogenase [Lachnospiraceae bacterium]